jgi:hypothetical protein
MGDCVVVFMDDCSTKKSHIFVCVGVVKMPCVVKAIGSKGEGNHRDPGEMLF